MVAGIAPVLDVDDFSMPEACEEGVKEMWFSVECLPGGVLIPMPIGIWRTDDDGAAGG